ncbi:7TM-DISM domain-containing protein [Chengkuizengella axinellae]|uniref:7TM-DISM domain-containing protein n=1 Tax=Chengkuizengella axinellae TaxID=3064388 RepID=A0ABT9IZ26_9BACL|nr:7TM-DISM domain-containing protein [Chengkuizengella sp. 2205SS18-9]MDP5274382.1 7TM-DISM domain-containing protein [Chengkuizengella sp. 2205SS18-9]
MKKAILVIASLLAVSSVMAAMAFSSATVKNDANFTITNTDEALLAVSTGEGGHNAAYYEEANDGARVLKIDFDRGHEGDFGLQPNSEYIWEDLFEVTNNSENQLDFVIGFFPNGYTYLKDADLYVKSDSGEWKRIDSGDNGDPHSNNSKLYINHINPGDSRSLDVKIVQGEGHDGGFFGEQDFEIVVSTRER